MRFFLFILFILTTSCSHLFYQPDAVLYTDKNKLQKYFNEIRIPGPEGDLIAWQFSNPALNPNEKKNVHILFFHGNAQNVSSHFYSLFWILKYGYDFTIIDYPGYGGSQGEPTRKTTTESALAAYLWVRSQNPNKKVLIFGQSLGGNIALHTAAMVVKETPDPQFCAVAVESTFLSYHRVARRVLSRHWSTWLFQPLVYVLTSDAYSADDEIKNLKSTPLLVLHGDQDPIIEFENGREVYDAALDPKTFVTVEKGKHIDAFTFANRNKYQKLFLQFIEKNCK